MTIQNQVNQNEKPIGISFRRKDQLSAGVIWRVFEKVSQSNTRINALGTLVVTVHSVRIHVGFGKHTIKSRGRPLSVMAHPKKIIVELKVQQKTLAHSPLLAIAKVENDPHFKAYGQGRIICHEVQTLLKTTA